MKYLLLILFAFVAGILPIRAWAGGVVLFSAGEQLAKHSTSEDLLSYKYFVHFSHEYGFGKGLRGWGLRVGIGGMSALSTISCPYLRHPEFFSDGRDVPVGNELQAAVVEVMRRMALYSCAALALLIGVNFLPGRNTHYPKLELGLPPTSAVMSLWLLFLRRLP
ncbi:MAG: hypothetical protein SPI72_03590 [Porphyromonas sp.]|nr:hypothetical protein [Porphyromonas sp.]